MQGKLVDFLKRVEPSLKQNLNEEGEKELLKGEVF
jgi:hypothetical protein